MSKPIIKVENLSKKYQLGARQEAYSTFRESLTGAMKAPLQRLRRNGRTAEDDTLWALKDVDFEVQPGEVVGIIGRNGAGKSTLLKVLSRITEPTTGSIKLYGRVASLLEVGTGFHPELTGRENIYLNGAILGMGKHEIERKFDEMVEFAEVEKFIDTPVKRYSSGMYLRLAFSVAAHLDPEILVVDEVLAVGDAAFQKKCLGKMSDVAKEGRTVLFVSHNMVAIQSLCSRAIYLRSGQISADGKEGQIVRKYLSDAKDFRTTNSIKDRVDRSGSGRIKITDFYVKDKHGVVHDTLEAGEDYTLVLSYQANSPMEQMNNVVASIGIKDVNEVMVLLVRSNFTNQNLTLKENKGEITCTIRNLNIAQGSYSIILFLSLGEFEVLDMIDNATDLIVEGGDFFGTGSIGLPTHCKTLTLANWGTL